MNREMCDLYGPNGEPPPQIELRASQVDPNSTGLWTRLPIRANDKFGPFEGERVQESHTDMNPSFVWEIVDLESREHLWYIDATDPCRGNWMRYIKCARFLEEQNIISSQEGTDIYYKAMKDIPAGVELLTWYERVRLKPGRKRRKVPTPQLIQSSSKTGKRRKDLEEAQDTESDSNCISADEALLPTKKTKRQIMRENSRNSPKRSEVKNEAIAGNSPKPSEVKKEASVDDDADDGEKSQEVENTVDDKNEKSNESQVSEIKINGLVLRTRPERTTVKKQKLETKFPKAPDYDENDGYFHFEIKENHIVRNRLNKKLFICDICSGEYKHSFSLKRHYIKHHINHKYVSEYDLGSCAVTKQNFTAPVESDDASKMINRSSNPDQHSVYSKTIAGSEQNCLKHQDSSPVKASYILENFQESQSSENSRYDTANSEGALGKGNDREGTKQCAQDSVESQTKSLSFSEETNDITCEGPKSNSSQNDSTLMEKDSACKTGSETCKERNELSKAVLEDDGTAEGNFHESKIHLENKTEDLTVLDKPIILPSQENVLTESNLDSNPSKRSALISGKECATKSRIREVNDYIDKRGFEPLSIKSYDRATDSDKSEAHEKVKEEVTDNENMELTAKCAEKSSAKGKKVPIMPGLYRCHLCAETFDTILEIRMHIKDHPESSLADGLLSCDQCEMKFSDRKNLMRHQSSHSITGVSSKGPVSKQCRYCGKAFPNSKNLRRHERVHEGVRHLCPHCGTSFTQSSDLKKHVRRLHPTSFFECGFCTQYFSTKKLLQDHLNTHNKGIQDNQSELNSRKDNFHAIDPILDRAESMRLASKRMYSSKDSDSFKFACTVCKKRFLDYSNMCRHRRLAHMRHLMDTVKTSERRNERIFESTSIIRTRSAVEREMVDFYANVADNIHDNLSNHMMGTKKMIDSAADLIKWDLKDSEMTSFEVKKENREKSIINAQILSKCNFPKTFRSKDPDHRFQQVNRRSTKSKSYSTMDDREEDEIPTIKDSEYPKAPLSNHFHDLTALPVPIKLPSFLPDAKSDNTGHTSSSSKSNEAKKCTVCKITFRNAREYRGHMRDEHGVNAIDSSKSGQENENQNANSSSEPDATEIAKALIKAKKPDINIPVTLQYEKPEQDNALDLKVSGHDRLQKIAKKILAAGNDVDEEAKLALETVRVLNLQANFDGSSQKVSKPVVCTEDPYEKFHRYLCKACHKEFSDWPQFMEHHNQEHPTIERGFSTIDPSLKQVWTRVTEPVGLLNVCSSNIQATEPRQIFHCTKCHKRFKVISDLHKHILECADPNTLRPKYVWVYQYRKQKYSKMKKKRTCEWQKKKTDNTSVSGVKSEPLQINGSRPLESHSKTDFLDDDEGKRRRKPFEIVYNPNRHTRRREMTEIVDTSICSGCGEDFKTISLLERHIPLCSYKDRICELDSLKSVYGAENSADSESDDDYDPNKHLCIYCVKQFTYMGSLRNHVFDICAVRKELMEKNEYFDEEWEQELVEKTGGKREQLSRRGSTDSLENSNLHDETSKDATESPQKITDKRQRRRRRGNGWGTPKAIKSSAFNKTIKHVVSEDGFIYEYYVESELPIVSFDLSDTFILDVDKNKEEGNVKRSSRKATKNVQNHIFKSDSKPIINTGPPYVPRQELPYHESDLQAEDLRKHSKKDALKAPIKERKSKLHVQAAKKEKNKAKPIKAVLPRTKRNTFQSKTITDYLKKKKKVINQTVPKATKTEKLRGNNEALSNSGKGRRSSGSTKKISEKACAIKDKSKTVGKCKTVKSNAKNSSSKKVVVPQNTKAMLAKCVKKKMAQKRLQSKIQKAAEQIVMYGKGNRRALSSKVGGRSTKTGSKKSLTKNIGQKTRAVEMSHMKVMPKSGKYVSKTKKMPRKGINGLVPKSSNSKVLAVNGFKRTNRRKKIVAEKDDENHEKEIIDNRSVNKLDSVSTENILEQPNFPNQPVKAKRKYTKKTLPTLPSDIPRTQTEGELRIQEKFKKVKDLLKRAGSFNKIVPQRESKSIEKPEKSKIENSRFSNNGQNEDTTNTGMKSKSSKVAKSVEKGENDSDMPQSSPMEGMSDNEEIKPTKNSAKTSSAKKVRNKSKITSKKILKKACQQSNLTINANSNHTNNKLSKKKLLSKGNNTTCDTVGASLDVVLTSGEVSHVKGAIAKTKKVRNNAIVRAKSKAKNKKETTKSLESPKNHERHELVMDTVADDELHLFAQMSPQKSPEGWGLKSSLATMLDAWNEAALECSLDCSKSKRRSRKHSLKHGKQSPIQSHVESNECLEEISGEKSQDEGYISVDKLDKNEKNKSTFDKTGFLKKCGAGKSDIVNDLKKPVKRKSTSETEKEESIPPNLIGVQKSKKPRKASMTNVQNNFANDSHLNNDEFLHSICSDLRKDSNKMKQRNFSPTKRNTGLEMHEENVKVEKEKISISRPNSRNSSPCGKLEKAIGCSIKKMNSFKSVSTLATSGNDSVGLINKNALDSDILACEPKTVTESHDEIAKLSKRRKSKNIFEAMDAMQRCDEKKTKSRSSSPALKKATSQNPSSNPVRAFKRSSKDFENSNSSNNSGFAADSIDLVTNTFCTAIMKSPKKLIANKQSVANICELTEIHSEQSQNHCIEAMSNGITSNSPKKHSVINCPNVFSQNDSVEDILPMETETDGDISKCTVTKGMVSDRCTNGFLFDIFKEKEGISKSPYKFAAFKNHKFVDNPNSVIDHIENETFSDDTETYSEYGDNQCVKENNTLSSFLD